MKGKIDPKARFVNRPCAENSCAEVGVAGRESKVLRLRLEKSPEEKGAPGLASAQDDSISKRRSFGNPAKRSVVMQVARKMERKRAESQPPKIDSFADFLTQHAQVKSGSGYIPYHFAGREALRPIVERLDQILASGEPDVSLALCGGAQFGKTVLMLNLLAYLVAVRFRNVGYYLPDDDLVSGLVDGKLRPDVLDQIPWLARLIAVGKTLNASGRAVNRKGAFLCTDGQRTALAFMRGLGKIPTSFSMDVVIQDEKDDLPDEHARFLAGRMTASNLRLSLIIGTQRYHGAGQNLAFTEGTQHIGLLTCPACNTKHNPETAWPGICRLVMDNLPSSDWPKLTVEGHFSGGRAQGKGEKENDGESSTLSLSPLPFSLQPIAYAPGQKFVLACPECGTALDRAHPIWHAQAPERVAQRKWSYRISQLLIPDIDLGQIVAAWQLAIRDPAQMTVFCTDRLALPKSNTQTLTPHDLQAARGNYVLGKGQGKKEKDKGQEAEAASSPFSFSPSPFTLRYGGLDMGDQCWFVAREVEQRPPHQARLLWIEPIAAERVRTRVPELFRQLNLTLLCVDAGPLRDLSRDLTFLLNDLTEDSVPSSTDPTHNIFFSNPGSGSRRPPGDCPLPSVAVAGPRDGASKLEGPAPSGPRLLWHAASEKWQGLRCAPVEFTQREGQGLRHKLARTQGGRLYPLIAAHRDETIQRVITELLPPCESQPRLQERADGTALSFSQPRFLLPTPTDETRNVLDLYERHLLAGARQERSADGRTLRYLDKCENHFLLATAYAALAELLGPGRDDEKTVVPAFRAVSAVRGVMRRERSVIG
jgi:hypothetical protein